MRTDTDPVVIILIFLVYSFITIKLKQMKLYEKYGEYLSPKYDMTFRQVTFLLL